MSAIENPLPVSVAELGGIPRRICLHHHTPAEQAIRNAIAEVEKLGADILLTAAVNTLQKAQGQVADWLEGKVGIPEDFNN